SKPPASLSPPRRRELPRNPRRGPARRCRNRIKSWPATPIGRYFRPDFSSPAGQPAGVREALRTSNIGDRAMTPFANDATKDVKQAVTREELQSSTPAQKSNHKRTPGLSFRRLFTKPTVSPYDEVEWELRTAQITDAQGNIIFEQK